jgi:hypothetical protein
MIETSIAMAITFGTCIVTYFWGRSEITNKNIDQITTNMLEVLDQGGYIKTKLNNGEIELVKLSD